jgi:protein-S-isoprenylcysteine O-methyltransferase Ste14
MSGRPMARTAFWIITLAGLSPLYLRLFDSRHRRPFVARSRWIILIRFAELTTVSLFLAVMVGRHWDFPLTRFSAAAAAAGLILAAWGAFLTSWAKIRLGAQFSTTLGVKQGHQLISVGPYAWVRHPIYTGLLLVLLGGALVYNSGAVLVLLAAPFCCFFYCQSAVEEKLLLAHFGDEYRRYRARTGWLLPRIRVRSSG